MSSGRKKPAWQQKAVTEAHERYLAGMRELTLLRLAEWRMGACREGERRAVGAAGAG